MAINKQELLDLLRSRIAERLDSLNASQATVQSGAFHEENRQEHPKDTRAIEAAYLARGLAERVESMLDTAAALEALKVRDFGEDDPIALTAVVALVDGTGEESLYFLVPRGGGEALDYDSKTFHAITPQAPIGRALIGQYVGDELSLVLPQGIVRMTVGWVA